jgi:hypothetical protein
MKAVIDLLRSKWWSPLLTAPGVSVLLLFLIPSIPLIAMNSRSGLLALSAAGCLLLPWLIARIHGLLPNFLALEFYAVMAVAWFSKPSVFDGNQKLALATYMIPWMALAQVLVAVTASALLRKKVAK